MMSRSAEEKRRRFEEEEEEEENRYLAAVGRGAKRRERISLYSAIVVIGAGLGGFVYDIKGAAIGVLLGVVVAFVHAWMS